MTAHCFGHGVLPGLIEAGIDCIEHGTGLTEDLIDAMVEHGTALVPTVMQLDKFPEYAAARAGEVPRLRRHDGRPLRPRCRATIMAAYEAGVPIYAGSDGGGISRHGNIAGEIEALVRIGMPAHDALGAASWRAREWLGVDGLVEGASADFVVYDRDPRADLSVLRTPDARSCSAGTGWASADVDDVHVGPGLVDDQRAVRLHQLLADLVARCGGR